VVAIRVADQFEKERCSPRTRPSSAPSRTATGFPAILVRLPVVDLDELEDLINDARGRCDSAVEELRRGQEKSHRMWFVFPQIAGLGQSSMSRNFAIFVAGRSSQHRANLRLN